MSHLKDDCDVIVIEDDDDDDVVVIEDSDTTEDSEITEDSESTISADDVVIIEPHPQGNQEASQRNYRPNLKRNRPNSEEVELISPLHKRIQSSDPRQNYMESCHPSLPMQKQGNGAQTNLVGASLQSAEHPEVHQPVLREQEPVLRTGEEITREQEQEDIEGHRMPEEAHRNNPPLPRIISAHSLQPYFTPGSHFPGIAIMSYYFSDSVENYTRDVSSARATVALPTAILSQRQSSQANNPEMMTNPTLLENSTGNIAATLPYVRIPPNGEKLEKTDIHLEGNPENVNYSNDCGQETTSSALSVPPNLEMLDKAQTIMKESSETMDNPPLLERDNDQNTSPTTSSLNPNFGYLGDPKRNVKMLDTHLVAAQKKGNPTYAARYLVRHLFPKEVLMCSSVGGSSQGYQPLLLNKLSAIREYLAIHFPNYDLSEYGKDWKNCISDISSMMCCLCCIAKNLLEKRADKNEGPINADTPVFADPSGKEDGNESSSKASQPTTSLENRENEDSQENSEAIPEEVREASADNMVKVPEALENFGNPCRNVQMPNSVLTIARKMCLPELAARYLIRNLFTEDVLIRSKFYSQSGHGMCAFNSNKTSAVREFLQDSLENDWTLLDMISRTSQ